MDTYAACPHWTRYTEIYFNKCAYCKQSSNTVSGYTSLVTIGYHDAGCSPETCKGMVCSVVCRAVCEDCFLEQYDVIEEGINRGHYKKITAMKKLPLNRNAKSAYNKPY